MYSIGQYVNLDEDIISYVDINKLNVYLENKGWYMEKIIGEPHEMNDINKKFIMDKLIKMNGDSNAQQIFNSLLIKDYIIRVGKI